MRSVSFLFLAMWALCSSPVIACDDVYQGDPAVPEAALSDLDYAQTGAATIQLVAMRGPAMRFFAPPQRVFIQRPPQRVIVVPPQRFIVQQQRPQRVFIQRPPQRVIVVPQQRFFVRPQRVFRAPPQQQFELAPY